MLIIVLSLLGATTLIAGFVIVVNVTEDAGVAVAAVNTFFKAPLLFKIIGIGLEPHVPYEVKTKVGFTTVKSPNTLNVIWGGDVDTFLTVKFVIVLFAMIN